MCLPCRRSWKRGWEASRNPEWRKCPHCADVMIHAGAALAVPRRSDTEGWRVLTVLLNAGIHFHKSCCGGPGYRPRTMREVRERLAYARTSGEPVARALVRTELPRARPHRSPRRGRAPHGR
ncbi:deoxyxylulose-5-phosphate synthase [Streptomyces alkaliphilus]|uniref:Deoxyxylulose-5-phosphate synthase n=2 Tax=Streptomyces alkaliphilus TaxID=1472722 RepID=A0A7W3TB28_9ACTN|nr:deoxyxylulose-5-phosphate synthase [Streptomyces alkaliphilus]